MATWEYAYMFDGKGFVQVVYVKPGEPEYWAEDVGGKQSSTDVRLRMMAQMGEAGWEFVPTGSLDNQVNPAGYPSPGNPLWFKRPIGM